MANFWRQRTLIIGAVIVAISIGIIFSSIPFLPRMHVSISTSTSHSIHGGTQSYPGVYALKIPGVLNNQNLDVQVSIVNGTANFCVIADSIVEPWILSGNGTNGAAGSFPFTNCIVQQQTTQTTLQFTSTSQGTWDIVALNSDPRSVTVVFNPA